MNDENKMDYCGNCYCIEDVDKMVDFKIDYWKDLKPTTLKICNKCNQMINSNFKIYLHGPYDETKWQEKIKEDLTNSKEVCLVSDPNDKNKLHVSIKSKDKNIGIFDDMGSIVSMTTNMINKQLKKDNLFNYIVYYITPVTKDFDLFFDLALDSKQFKNKIIFGFDDFNDQKFHFLELQSFKKIYNKCKENEIIYFEYNEKESTLYKICEFLNESFEKLNN